MQSPEPPADGLQPDPTRRLWSSDIYIHIHIHSRIWLPIMKSCHSSAFHAKLAGTRIFVQKPRFDVLFCGLWGQRPTAHHPHGPEPLHRDSIQHNHRQSPANAPPNDVSSRPSPCEGAVEPPPGCGEVVYRLVHTLRLRRVPSDSTKLQTAHPAVTPTGENTLLDTCVHPHL